MSKESEQQSAKKKQSSSAVWSQIGKDAKGPASQVSGLNRSIDSAGDLTGADTADLQQTYGNSFLQRVVQMGGGEPNGSNEAESAGAAEQITPISREASSGSGGEVETRINRSRGHGQSLPDGLRGKMEGSFGADFSGVKVHNDGESDQLNRSLGAQAFTTGSDIYFQQGKYDPDSQSGQKLIAHELTHVVQQGGAARSSVQPKLEVSKPDDKFEQEAEKVADSVMSTVSSGTQNDEPKTDPTPMAGNGMTAEAEDAADEAGVSTSQVDSLTERANEKVAEGADPKEVAKGAKNQITGKGGIGKPVDAGGSMMGKAAKETESEAKKAKENHDPDKIIVNKVDPGVKKVPGPEQDESDSLKFDESEIEEPNESLLLPNWGELAYGTVQLFATGEAAEEIDWRATQTQQSPMADQSQSAKSSASTSAPDSAESSSTEPEPLDRDELIKDALMGGAAEGAAMGATAWAADTLMETATNSVPYADGWINLGNILMDPDGWAKGVEKTFSADNAKQTFGGWGDISKETTDEGRAAFVLEKILGIISWVEAINGFFQSMLQIGIAVLYLAWTIANSIPGGQPVAAAIMVVIKFLEWILKMLIFFGNLLLMFKPPLQFTIMGLRIADLKKAEADPQALLEKQAKLRGMTTEFTTGLTQRGLQTAAIKYREYRQGQKKNDYREQISNMAEDAQDADTGKSRQQLMDDYEAKYGEKYDAAPESKKSLARRGASLTYGVLFGVGGGAFSGIKGNLKDVRDAKKLRDNTYQVAKNFSRVKQAQNDLDNGFTYEQNNKLLKEYQDSTTKKRADLEEKGVALKRRSDDLAVQDQDLQARSQTNRGDLDSAQASKNQLEAYDSAKRAEFDLADNRAEQEIQTADEGYAVAENSRRQGESELVTAEKSQQNFNAQLDTKRKRLADLDALAKRRAAAKKESDGKGSGAKIDMTARQRKSLEKQIASLENKSAQAAESKKVSRAKIKEAKEAKKAAKQSKSKAEAQKREVAEKRQELDTTVQQIAVKTEQIANLRRKQLAIEAAQVKTGRDREKNQADLENNADQFRKETDEIQRLKGRIENLADDWKYKSLGDSYLPSTGKKGRNEVFREGDFDSEYRGGKKKIKRFFGLDTTEGPRSKNLADGFGAGGQRHGSGITGGLAGNFMADGITFDYDWRTAWGLPDKHVGTITDRVQIAVDLNNAPNGIATGQATFFNLGPEEKYDDISALGTLEAGDEFPDQLRIILAKSHFKDDDVTLEAKSVRLRHNNGAITLYTPSVSSVTVVESEGAVDEGSGEDRVVSGQKIKKYKFNVSYSTQELSAAAKMDESPGTNSGGLLLQRQAADDEEESIEEKKFKQEKEILDKLPEPPEGAAYQINSSATAHNALAGEEFELQIQQQEFSQIAQDNQGQKMEADSIAQAVETNQQAVDKHQQVTEESQAAQKEMEAGAKQAEQPAQQGFDLSQEIGKLLQMLVEPLIKGLMTAGEESGSGNQSGGAKEVDKFGGMQGDAMDVATNTTGSSQAQSREWQAESAILHSDIRKQQYEHKKLEGTAVKQQNDVESATDGIQTAQEANEEQLDEVQSLMDDQILDHEEASSEIDDWASEHQEMRLDLYDQLEADLEAEEEKQSQVEAEEFELG